MKQIFTLFIGLVSSSISLLAFDGRHGFDGSRLTISSVSSAVQFKVEVDGRPFSMKDNSLMIGYLGEGLHQVKIYREGRRNKIGRAHV